jgi:hypothetical protein
MRFLALLVLLVVRAGDGGLSGALGQATGYARRAPRNDGLDPPIAHTAMIAYCQCFARRVKQISLKAKMCNAAKGAATVHGVVFEILA